MPRRNLSGCFGESDAISVRLTPDDRRALRTLAAGWGCVEGEVLRRALREAFARELFNTASTLNEQEEPAKK